MPPHGPLPLGGGIAWAWGAPPSRHRAGLLDQRSDCACSGTIAAAPGVADFALAFMFDAGDAASFDGPYDPILCCWLARCPWFLCRWCYRQALLLRFDGSDAASAGFRLVLRALLWTSKFWIVGAASGVYLASKLVLRLCLGIAAHSEGHVDTGVVGTYVAASVFA